jgi:hypothetical protein
LVTVARPGRQIKPQQNTESGLKAKESDKKEAQSAAQPVPSESKVLPEGADRERQSQPDDRSNQGTEFWPSFYGYRLKVTDSLLVAVTSLLFFATLALWLATRRLVKGAEQTAERQLRAYVWAITENSPSLDADPFETRTHINNAGATPAYKVHSWGEIKPFFHPLADNSLSPFGWRSHKRATQLKTPRHQTAAAFVPDEGGRRHGADLDCPDGRQRPALAAWLAIF